MTERHPFVKAVLQKAVRDLLKDKHGHATPAELTACHLCMSRFWQSLAAAAPRPWIGQE